MCLLLLPNLIDTIDILLKFPRPNHCVHRISICTWNLQLNKTTNIIIFITTTITSVLSSAYHHRRHEVLPPPPSSSLLSLSTRKEFSSSSISLSFFSSVSFPVATSLNHVSSQPQQLSFPLLVHTIRPSFHFLADLFPQAIFYSSSGGASRGNGEGQRQRRISKKNWRSYHYQESSSISFPLVFSPLSSVLQQL